MEIQEKDIFNYTYSAKQQEEIKNIRSKYVAQEEDKMEQLRKLDQQVTQKATTAGIAIGVIGTLILGMGMSLVMTNLSDIIGITDDLGMVIGLIIGVVGLALVSVAHPIYTRTLKQEREKAAPQILRLTDELIKS